MTPEEDRQRFNAAAELHNAGKFAEAARVYADLLTRHRSGQLADTCLFALALVAYAGREADPVKGAECMVVLLRDRSSR